MVRTLFGYWNVAELESMPLTLFDVDAELQQSDRTSRAAGRAVGPAPATQRIRKAHAADYRNTMHETARHIASTTIVRAQLPPVNGELVPRIVNDA